MAVRFSMRSAVIGVFVGLGLPGCSGDGDDKTILPGTDTDADTDTITGDDTGSTTDTVPDGGVFIDAAAFVITARFAYDPDAQLHTGFAEPGAGLSPISLEVLLIDGDALYSGVLNDQTSCAVTIEVDASLPAAGWVKPNGAWTGFDLPDGTLRDGCVNYGLPGEFGGDVGSHVAKWSWGAGLGPLDEDLAEELRLGLPPSEWAALEPTAVGGALQSDRRASFSRSPTKRRRGPACRSTSVKR